MKRFLSVFIVLTFLLALVTGCTTQPAASPENNTPSAPELQKGGTLVVGHPSDPMTYNPDFKPDDMAMIVVSNVMNKLVTLDYDWNVMPDLAQSWDITEEGTIYTFHLAENVTWHDGTPFTSADVKWTYDTILSENGVMAGNMRAIEEITCPDEYTVVLHLSQPDAPLLGFLGWYGTFILPKHIYEGTDWTSNPTNQSPIGTGPYKFVEHQKGVSVTIEKNENYFKGEPYLDRIVFSIIPDSNTALQSLLNGEIDSLGMIQPALSELGTLKTNPELIVVQKAMPSRSYVPFNFNREPWNNLAVRQAVAYAINREEVVTKALKGVGTVAEGFYTPSIAWAYNDVDIMPERDVEKANQLLDEAGFSKDENGVRFTGELPYFTAQPQWQDIATVLKANLAEIGIEVKLVQLEMAAYMEQVFHGSDFDITVLGGGWGPDPASLQLRVGSKGGFNFSGYGNAEADNLFAQAAQLTNTEERAVLYKQIQTILANDLAFVPLAESQTLRVFSKKMHGHPMDEALGEVGMYDLSLAWLEQN